MKNYRYTYVTLLITLIFSSCTNVSEEDLIDNTPPPDMVNYEEDIKVIFENNCNFCHGVPPTNGASTSLVTYQDVVNGIQNNNVINRIAAQPGEAGAMPLGGPRLPQNLIDLIIQWEDEGFLENQ